MGPLMPLSSAAAVASGVVLLTASLVHAQGPTLSDLARKEQERRKALKAPARVLSPADVPKAAPATPAVASPPAATETKAPDKTEKPDEPAKDEAWWKARVSQVREDLRRNEMFAEALQTRINSLSNDFAARDDPYQRARVAEERLKAVAELDRVKADIELQKKRIAEIEDEARRAGVPPGWVR